MSCRLHAKMTSMRTDQTQFVARSSTQFKASDLKAILRKVENEVEDLGTYMSMKGVKMLHHKSALGRSTIGSSEFVRQCGGPNFLDKPTYDVIRRQAVAHLSKCIDVKILDFDEAKTLVNRKANFMRLVVIKVVNSLFVPGIDTPAVDDVKDNVAPDRDGRLCVEGNGCRHMQRVISAIHFSQSKQRWQDSVLVRVW